MKRILPLIVMAFLIVSCGGEAATCQSLVNRSDWGSVNRYRLADGNSARLKLRFTEERWSSLVVDIREGRYQCSNGTIETDKDGSMRPFASVCELDVGMVINWGGEIFIPELVNDLSDLELFNADRLRELCPLP